jgi:DNA-binding MarR family transcriptional regulator
MTIIRAERPHINYTIIKNETLRNNSLSFRARGIHAYLLSMPDNWRTSALQMSRQGQEGRDAILKALQELEEAGFVKRTKSQDAQGTLAFRDHRLRRVLPNPCGNAV